ncbi:SulP family inorganic anion transporter [Rhodospirillum rubrum]|uniref:Sulfate transporter/antisigma-factor antagonist n=1 Tax=Rhodospirillum rubrum (strain ATCC 11170 / ATH 1.1.1 / DSM 467 / LMG 4362 / NCIMB 8255 / S1) TaxID=269796 RepID=Q2RT39_RHORT|nr:SulP family inorganic anion transporter [Rhodospirillum rubrum]ABC22706.1 Sulfate transporter/antisigma-factor antagonist [Rhodospirillum rubrum ATCC 11170]AEO48425.1 sulfate transporter/antisigma-factor antagonist [Rhodospirillum rubrum F11]MBK5954304.1 SulP family inorganic anion transporter [Rhodospirillum rubrum]QXG78698.1 SulP family inorganic anion transporter [Rhodospirillum rubrum]HAP98630.1 SulP family inorganic anion transporter [Rhodospirillum rubrum]
MSALINGLRFDTLRGDLFGGITAAVVALPLALAFGVASGAGAIAGLYGAIFVGFFAALFGGTPAQVSGPTGPMTVVMTGVVMQFAHDPALAFTVVMMGGLVQMIFGALGLGRYVTYVPTPVVSGFMSGIGAIIIILEIAPLLGVAGGQEGVLATLAALPRVIAATNPAAAGLGALTLALVVLWPKAWGKIVPAALVALVVGTLIARFALPGVPVIGAIPTGFPQPHLPSIDLGVLPSMIASALMLGLLGCIDSLLTSLVADTLTRVPHKSDRELLGQGLGNVIAGLFGGIPGAGATMRTVINIRAGGRTPLSGALHALVLLALVLGLAPLAEGVPHAVLAGILLKVGWDIIDWPYLRRLRQAPRDGVVTMVVVLVLTVAVDLITAVAVGIIVKSLLAARAMAPYQLDRIRVVSGDGGGLALGQSEQALLARAGSAIALVHLSGPFSFCSANDMIRRSLRLGGTQVVVFDLTEVPMIDTSVALALGQMIGEVGESGARVVIAGMGGPGIETLATLGVLDRFTPADLVETRRTALERALSLVEEKNTPGNPDGENPNCQKTREK